MLNLPITLYQWLSIMVDKHFLIGYDIGCNGNRARALRRIRKWSLAYQKSALEMTISKSEIGLLLYELVALLDPSCDALLVMPISLRGGCWRLGSSPLYLDMNSLIVVA